MESKRDRIGFSELDNIKATAHFGNLVGLDTEFQDADVLWILFAPELERHEILWRAKMFFGNDAEPLIRELNKKTGKWELARDAETGMYKNPRVQKVGENAIIGELIQAIRRARLVRKARKVIILTSHHIAGITDRPEKRLFDEADWEITGSLDTLDDAIANSENAEIKATELTAQNTIADFREVLGCSSERF